MTHARYVRKKLSDGQFRRDVYEAIAARVDAMSVGDVLRLPLGEGCPCYTWWKKRSMLNGFEIRQIRAGLWKVVVRVK